MGSSRTRTRVDLSSCVVDPATENWKSKDDVEVYHAAKAGVPQAVKELARREAKAH